MAQHPPDPPAPAAPEAPPTPRLILRLSRAGGRRPIIVDSTDGLLRFLQAQSLGTTQVDDTLLRSGALDSDAIGDLFLLRWHGQLSRSYAGGDGGIHGLLPEESRQQIALLGAFLANLGRSLLTLDLTRVTMPIGLSQARTVLEVGQDNTTYMPYYLRAACLTTNPVDRLSFFVASTFAGLSVGLGRWKPVNAILGTPAQPTSRSTDLPLNRPRARPHTYSHHTPTHPHTHTPTHPHTHTPTHPHTHTPTPITAHTAHRTPTTLFAATRRRNPCDDGARRGPGVSGAGVPPPAHHRL